MVNESEVRITLDASQYEASGKKVEDVNRNIEDSAERAGEAISGLEDSLGRSTTTSQEAAVSTGRVAEATTRVADSTRGLAATRYALYDVATTWGAISAATLGAATAVETVGAQYEYAFSAVRRVTQTAGGEAAALNQDLKDLASTIHEEFGAISEVATLGGQMDVATDELAEFTRNVTMFGATTSATVQEAAMGFGRIAQLTSAGADSWESIGSAIYQVGITSVATESQILNVAQEIATAGNLAGFSTAEVIGLAGALASLGVQPERARGNVLRIFSEIDRAVGEGGERLERFGQAAGTSAQAFAEAWKNAPEAAFRSLIEGLNAATEAGGNLGQNIRALGITAVRDVQTLQQLANNTEVYARAMGEANSAYRDGSALMDAYSIRSDTVIGKLQILRNVINNVMDSLSNNSAIKFFLDQFIMIGRAVETVLKNDIAAFVGSIGVAFLGLVGITAAVRSAMTAMQASVLALRLAIINMQNPAIQNLDRGLKGLIGELGRLNQVMKGTQATTTQTTGALSAQVGTVRTLAAAHGQLATAQGAGAASSAASVGVMGRVAGAARTAGTAVTALVGSLRAFWPLAAVSGIIWGISAAINQFASDAEKADRAAREMFGSMGGLSEAIAQDTQIYHETGEAIRTLLLNTEEGSVIWDSAAQSQETLAGAMARTSEEIETQTVALGQNYQEAMKAIILGSEDFVENWDQITTVLQDSGQTIDDLFAALSTGTAGGFFDDISASALASKTEIYNNIRALQEEKHVLEQRQRTNYLLSDSDQARLNTLKQLIPEQQREWEVLDAQIRTIEKLSPALEGLTNQTTELTKRVAIEKLWEKFWDGAHPGNLDEEIGNLTETISNLFSELESAHATQGALDGLVDSFLSNSDAITDMTEGGRANFDALMNAVNLFAQQANGDLWQFGNSLVEMFAYTEGAGIQFGSEVDFLREQMVSVFNQQWGLDLDVSAANGSIQTFIQNALVAVRTRAILERASLQAAYQRVAPFDSMAGTALQLQMGALDRQTQQQVAALEGLSSQLTQVTNQGRQAAQNFYNPPGRSGRGKSPIGKDARDAAKEVRTLSDYVKELGGVMNDAFQFRFGLIMSTDQLEAAKRSLRELKDDALQRVIDAFEDLAKARQRVLDLRVAIQELNASIRGLEADQSRLQYFYEIAVEYGDMQRAEQIAAELEKVNADLAKAENDRAKEQKNLSGAQTDVTKASKEVSDAQRDSIRTLTGNTAAAAEQRGAVMDLLKAYQDQVVELAGTGLSQDQLKKKTEELRKEFERELTQLGYNKDEVRAYGKSFEDLSRIIQAIPPANVSVSANTNPATRAINEWIAANNKKSVTIRANVSTGSVGNIAAGQLRPSSIYSTGNMSINKVVTRGAATMELLRGGGGAGKMMMYNTGGFTGQGGMNSLAGYVHKGEFVHRKSDVDQNTGLPYASVLATMLTGTREFSALMSAATAGRSGGGRSMIDLSPSSIQALAQAVRPLLVIDDKVIAGANASANAQATSVGAY